MVEPASLLPPNATPFETAESKTSARMLDAPTEDIRLVRRAATCPSSLLPYLAWERSVDEWDPDWSDDIKRAVIAASFTVHQHKGTRYALDVALEALGMSLTTSEWFEYGGDPYRFKIAIGLDTVTAYNIDQHALIVRTAFAAKNTRSYLEAIEIKRPGTTGPVYASAALSMRIVLKHSYDPLSAIRVQGYAFAGVAVFARQTMTLQ